MPPFNILLYDHTAALGGGEIALLNFLKVIDRNVVNPSVLLGNDGPLADELRPLCPVYILPLPEKVSGAKKDHLGFRSVLRVFEITEIARYTWQLSRWIRKNHVQLIHTNSLKSDIIGGIAGRLARILVVWHIRDRIERDYLPRSVVLIFRRLCRIIPTHVLANSAATLATLCLGSVGNRSASPSASGVRPKTEVVHDGLPLTPVTAVTSTDSVPTIGLIGRISPWKGQHIFLDAAKLVTQRHSNARFRIIGAPLFGEAEYEQAIRAQRSKLGLDDTVELVGFKSDIPAEIEKLTILVHASTSGEPFGQVIVEGMAGQKPVIATNGGGVPEIVVHGQTGLLIPMSDPHAMAEAICSLIESPARAIEMGRLGYERVRAHFTIERTARQIEDVYKRALGMRPVP